MGRCVYYVFLVAILCTTPALIPVAAQEGEGSIIGTVKDSTNAALKGALVKIQPTGRRAVSDGQGQFKLTDLPGGDSALTVRYGGFPPFTASVKAPAGQAASMDAAHYVASVNEHVTVIAERLQGEIEAISGSQNHYFYISITKQLSGRRSIDASAEWKCL